MAIGGIGHWRDSAGGQIPGTSFAGHAFATEVRNDGAYTSLGSGEFQIDEAGDYLIIGTIKYEDTSNGRFQPQAGLDFTMSTGTPWSAGATGYSRDSSEDTAWVKVLGVMIAAESGDTFTVITRRDVDAPTGGSVVDASDIQIVRIDAVAAGIYGPLTASQTLGGTTPTTANLGTTQLETDTASIERTGDTITMKTSGARYLVLSSLVMDSAANRTQRWSLHNYTNGPANSPRSYAYARNAANSRIGTTILDIVEHDGVSDPTVELQAYRGDGVAAGDGGADIDASAITPSITPNLGGLAVIELPSTAEVYRVHDSAGGQDLTTSPPTSISMNGTVYLEDTASFNDVLSNRVEAAVAMDALIVGNVGTARQDVASGARWTAYGSIAINLTAEAVGEHGNYDRGNQGTIDTFGWSVTPGGIYDLSALDTASVTVDELPGGEAGGSEETNAGWSHLVAINLDTLIAGTPVTADGIVATAAWSAVDASAVVVVATPVTADGIVAEASWSAVDATEALGAPASGTPPTFERVTVWEGGNSIVNSFTPLSGTDRCWLVMIGHVDPNIGERTSVQVSYDNNALVPGELEHRFANNGSFSWDMVQVDIFVANETFIAARASSANLTVQNIGPNAIVAIVELSDAGTSFSTSGDSSGTAGGTATSSSVSIVTLDGTVDMDHTFAASKFAHAAISVAGATDPGYTLYDIIARNLEDGITVDASQTTVTTQTRAGAGVLEIAVSSESPAAASTPVTADGIVATAAWSAIDATDAQQAPIAENGVLATAAWSAVDATDAQQANTATDGIVAEASWSAVDATEASQATTADGTVAVATWSALDGADATQAALAENGTPAESTWAAVDATGTPSAALTADGTPASSSWSAVDAAGTVTGAVTADGTPAAASWSALDATEASQATTADAIPPSSTWSAVDAADAQQVALVESATPASAAWAALDASPVVAAIGADGTVAVAAWVAVDAAAALAGAVTADGAPAEASWSAVDATEALGAAVSADGTVAEASWTALDGTAAIEAGTVADGTPAAAAWSAIDATEALGAPLAADGTPAAAAWTALDAQAQPAVSGGADGIAAVATWAAVDASSTPQTATAANADPASSSWSAIDATEALGAAVTADGVPSSAAWSAVDGAEALQTAQSANGDPADASWSAIDGTGSSTITAANGLPALAQWAAVAAAAVLAPAVTADAAPAEASWSAVDAAAVAQPATTADGELAAAAWSALDATDAIQPDTTADATPASGAWVSVDASGTPADATAVDGLPAVATWTVLEAFAVPDRIVVVDTEAFATLAPLGSSVIDLEPGAPVADVFATLPPLVPGALTVAPIGATWTIDPVAHTYTLPPED